MTVLASVVFVPSAPLLVPEVAGPRATDTDAVRAATRAAGRELANAASSWVAIGARDDDSTSSVGLAGSFARYGVDVSVSLGAPHPGSPARDGGSSPAQPADLPLSMLIAGWLRAESGVDVVEPITVAPAAAPAECARVGAELRSWIDTDPQRWGVLVVADGATALSPRAPGGGLRPAAVHLQHRVDDALAAADLPTLAMLDPVECTQVGAAGRPAWQIAAELCSGRLWKSQVSYCAAPFGVGYTVATWTPR